MTIQNISNRAGLPENPKVNKVKVTESELANKFFKKQKITKQRQYSSEAILN